MLFRLIAFIEIISSVCPFVASAEDKVGQEKSIVAKAEAISVLAGIEGDFLFSGNRDGTQARPTVGIYASPKLGLILRLDERWSIRAEGVADFMRYSVTDKSNPGRSHPDVEKTNIVGSATVTAAF